MYCYYLWGPSAPGSTSQVNAFRGVRVVDVPPDRKRVDLRLVGTAAGGGMTWQRVGIGGGKGREREVSMLV